MCHSYLRACSIHRHEVEPFHLSHSKVMGEKQLHNENSLPPHLPFYTPMGDKNERRKRTSLKMRTKEDLSLEHIYLRESKESIGVYFYSSCSSHLLRLCPSTPSCFPLLWFFSSSLQEWQRLWLSSVHGEELPASPENKDAFTEPEWISFKSMTRQAKASPRCYCRS